MSVEERLNAISDNVTKVSLSVAKLWEIQTEGLPPHKTTFNLMLAILAASIISAAISVFIAVEMYVLLTKVNAIYSLML